MSNDNINPISQHRENLISVLMNEIIDQLPCRMHGYEFPFHFVKLSSSDVHSMVTEMETSTALFGDVIACMRNDLYGKPFNEMIDAMNNAFWLPAVQRIWPLQCFEVHRDSGAFRLLYLLARTSPDEWVGLQTQVCYIKD